MEDLHPAKTVDGGAGSARAAGPAVDSPDDEAIRRWVEADGRFTHAIVRVIITPIFYIGFRLRSFGQEHIPPTGGFLLCPNHSSWWDPFLQGLGQRRIIRFMGKAQVFGWPLVGRIAAAGGAFPVHRGQGDQAAIEIARRIVSSGEPVVIYAEGTRFRADEHLGPARRGVARLAIETGVPVIPCATWGAKPRSARGERGVPWRLPKVTTVYGPPLSFAGLELTQENVDRVRDEIWAEVHRLYGIARDLHRRRPFRYRVPGPDPARAPAAR